MYVEPHCFFQSFTELVIALQTVLYPCILLTQPPPVHSVTGHRYFSTTAELTMLYFFWGGNSFLWGLVFNYFYVNHFFMPQ